MHGGTQARITNRGRKAGESPADRDARLSLLHYIAAHAAERPTRIDESIEALHLEETDAYRAILSLAASGLITHKRAEQGLGLVQITPRGQAKTTPVSDDALDAATAGSPTRR